MPRPKKKIYLKTVNGTLIMPISFMIPEALEQVWIRAHPDNCSMEYITHIATRSIVGGKEAVEKWLETNKS